jgi:hypothetical protein
VQGPAVRPTPYVCMYVFFAYWRVEAILSPLGTSATEWPIVPAPGDYDDGVFGGMKIGTGNRSTRRKPAPAPLCPLQIPHDQTRARTPGRRDGKSATNRLSHGAAICMYLCIYVCM